MLNCIDSGVLDLLLCWILFLLFYQAIILLGLNCKLCFLGNNDIVSSALSSVV